jgi:hypothetical protein
MGLSTEHIATVIKILLLFCMGEWLGLSLLWQTVEKHVKFLTEKRKGRDHLEDQGADGSVMLKWAYSYNESQRDAQFLKFIW